LGLGSPFRFRFWGFGFGVGFWGGEERFRKDRAFGEQEIPPVRRVCDEGYFCKIRVPHRCDSCEEAEREYSKIGFHAVDPLCSLTLEFNFSVTVGAGIKVQE
jgi:hypothetical protein